MRPLQLADNLTDELPRKQMKRCINSADQGLHSLTLQAAANFQQLITDEKMY